MSHGNCFLRANLSLPRNDGTNTLSPIFLNSEFGSVKEFKLKPNATDPIKSTEKLDITPENKDVKQYYM